MRILDTTYKLLLALAALSCIAGYVDQHWDDWAENFRDKSNDGTGTISLSSGTGISCNASIDLPEQVSTKGEAVPNPNSCMDDQTISSDGQMAYGTSSGTVLDDVEVVQVNSTWLEPGTKINAKNAIEGSVCVNGGAGGFGGYTLQTSPSHEGAGWINSGISLTKPGIPTWKQMVGNYTNTNLTVDPKGIITTADNK